MLTAVFMLGVVVAVLAWAWRSHRLTEEGDEICSTCGYDLRASTGRCPECGQPFTRAEDHFPLRDDWPADPISPRRPAAGEIPVCIHTTEKEWEARTLCEQFEARGVRAQVQAPAAMPIDPATAVPMGAISGWRVAVWSGDVELAQAIRDKLIPNRPPPPPEA